MSIFDNKENIVKETVLTQDDLDEIEKEYQRLLIEGSDDEPKDPTPY